MKESKLKKSIQIIQYGVLVIQVLTIGYALYKEFAKTQPMQDSTKRSGNKKRSSDGKRDVVDETSIDSFPASDPPAWNTFN